MMHKLLHHNDTTKQENYYSIFLQMEVGIPVSVQAVNLVLCPYRSLLVNFEGPFGNLTLLASK